MTSIWLNYIDSFWLFRKCIKTYIKTYLKNAYQFFDTLKTNILKLEKLQFINKSQISWIKVKFSSRYPKCKFASEIGHFLSLPKLTQTYFNFKICKFKMIKMSKIKIHILEIG